MTGLDLEQASLSGDYRKQAVYFLDSDCVEYIKEDTFAIYERIDNFLTLIFDDTKFNLIGFKLKGFRHFFNTVKDKLELREQHFVRLVQVIEAHSTELGEKLIQDDYTLRAYRAAQRLAANDNVELDGGDLNQPAAA